MSSRIKHRVDTTIDSVCLYAASVGVSGTATGLATTLMDSTELGTTVSGSSPGVVFVTLPKDLSYPQLISWTAEIRAGSTSSFNYGGQNQATKEHYIVEKTAFQYPTGSPIAQQGTPGYYMNPGTSTDPRAAAFGGGAVFRLEINSLRVGAANTPGAVVSGVLANPIDASVAPGSPTAVIDVTAVFRNRSRTRDR